MAGKGKAITKAGIDWAKTNPDKVDKAGRVANDVFNESLPPETPEGQVIVAGKKMLEKMYASLPNGKATDVKKKNRQTHTGWRGR